MGTKMFSLEFPKAYFMSFEILFFMVHKTPLIVRIPKIPVLGSGGVPISTGA